MDLHLKTFNLHCLVGVHGADAYLNKPVSQLFLHDAGEGAGMGITVAVIVVVEIRMGIEVQDGQGTVLTGQGPDNRIGYGMIAAQNQRFFPQMKMGGKKGLYTKVCFIGFLYPMIPEILERSVSKIDTAFRSKVG